VKPTTAAVAPSAAPAGAEVPDDQLPIVSKKERFLAGTEPHSPSTWGNSVDASSNARVTVGHVGIGSGFLPSGMLGPRGLVRVSLLGEYFNGTDFPVKNAQDIRSGITFAASWQPFEWGEIFVSYGAAANSNNRTAPNLIQALGDLTLGVKASYAFVKGLHTGLDLRLLTYSGVGNQSVDKFAVGFRPTFVTTWDVRTVAPSVPILATLNLGFTFDNTGSLVTGQTLNASEQFALGINKYNRFNFGLAVEVPLPVVSPFVEYAFGLPMGAGSLTGPDGVAVAATSAMPQTLGLGLKVTAVKDLTFLGGVNLGLSRSVGLGVPATPPWNLFLGASFTIDPSQRGETKFVDTVRERRVEQKVAEAAKTSHVEGLLTDAESKKPVSGAIVTVAGALPSASDATGGYRTLEVSGEKVKLTAVKDGYAPAEAEVALVPGKTAHLDLALKPDKRAVFEVSATSAKKPVKATVTFKGAADKELTTSETPGATSVELPAGTYTLTATAEGYLAQTREVQVAAGAKMPVAFDLQPAPKKSLVILKGDKIEILQQVHFATGKAQILADSNSLLQQVVDVVVKNGIKRMRVEGHTDNRGVKEANQALSDERARAVADYLIAQGVEKSRVEAVGYGDSKPIAPNLTARGRELNRRVEFIVLEK
jgi:outer membrane protein OmpA-like peptidoglycan-associated protein